MKLLLTSAGISNQSIQNALLDLLGKPIDQSNALFVPTAIYGITKGAEILPQVINGTIGDPFCRLEWKSLGILELTALPSLKSNLWKTWLEQADALLVGGGDCQYLCHWMHKSGLVDMLPTILDKIVYVGLSAGSMVMTSYGTTYHNHNLPPETNKSLGIVDFAIHPHLDHEWFPDNSLANLEKLSSTLQVSSYMIDDQTAIQVTNASTKVISEGKWRLYRPEKRA